MEQHHAKRVKSAADSALKEKRQNLPLLCIETIFKFTQTTKLIRLLSNAVPLPGAFWSFALDAALKKRLFALSFTDTWPHHQASVQSFGGFLAVYGAKLATVKCLEAFRFSPLCEFIDDLTLTVQAMPSSPFDDENLRLYVDSDKAWLLHLPSVTALTLIVRNISAAPAARMVPLEPILKVLLPRLRSFHAGLNCRQGYCARLETPLSPAFVREMPLRAMPNLRCLSFPPDDFEGLALATAKDREAKRATCNVLSNLSSLTLLHEGWSFRSFASKRASTLQLVASCCRSLTTFCVLVVGEFQAYLAAFRALSQLTSLGLRLHRTDTTGITVNEHATVKSVLDLRFVICMAYPAQRTTLFAVASLFPNAKAVAFQSDQKDPDLLDIASAFCSSHTLPLVQTLACFLCDPIYDCSGDQFAHCIANPDMPEAVDLSPVIFLNMAATSGFLASLYGAMQANSIKRLLFRGPVHLDALAELQRHLDLTGEDVSVTAWKIRDLVEQPGISIVPAISTLTDFRIVGTKSSGRLQCEQFTIRVFHQLAKRREIFDFVRL